MSAVNFSKYVTLSAKNSLILGENKASFRICLMEQNHLHFFPMMLSEFYISFLGNHGLLQWW